MQTFMRQFKELIKKMLIELSPNNSFLREVLDEQRNRAFDVPATEAMQLIRELQDSLYKVEYSDNWPLLRILIAFCYCGLNDVHTARLWAEDAVRILNATNKEWNLALAYWILAAVYNEEGYFKDSREQYINAQKTFNQVINNALNNNVGYRVKKECARRIIQLQYRIRNISSERSRLFDSARKDQKVNIATANHKTSEERPEERNTGATIVSAPIHVNIHAPIDNRSADHTDQRSLQYTHLQQDQESLSATSVPFSMDFTNVTQQPNLSSPKPPDNEGSTDVKNDVPAPIDVFDWGYLMTPSLPIYGSAGAGPDGQVVLNEPDYNAAIDESAFIRIDGEEYEIHSLRADNLRIKISHKDFLTSIIPRKMREIGRKAYGWLKVTGNSMNKGQPSKNEGKRIEIEDGDYVLFFESNNLSASVGKIVIVSESLPDSGPTRLLVKQLVKENNQLLLRSYSRDKNPNTGREFEDIDFNDCYQLIGEVIAVAKPRLPKEL